MSASRVLLVRNVRVPNLAKRTSKGWPIDRENDRSVYMSTCDISSEALHM